MLGADGNCRRPVRYSKCTGLNDACPNIPFGDHFLHECLSKAFKCCGRHSTFNVNALLTESDNISPNFAEQKYEKPCVAV